MQKKSPVFTIVVAAISLGTIVQMLLTRIDFYSLLSVAVAATGIVLFAMNHRRYDRLYYLWIVLQAPNFYYYDESGSLHPVMSAFPGSYFEASGTLGFHMETRSNVTVHMSFNILAVLLYFVFKYVNTDKSLGKKISIFRLKKDSFKQLKFPLHGTIEKISGRKTFTAIYLIKLDEGITFNGISYSHILLEPQKENLIDTHNDWQVCGFRICPKPEDRFYDRVNLFVEWVTLKVDE